MNYWREPAAPGGMIAGSIVEKAVDLPDEIPNDITQVTPASTDFAGAGKLPHLFALFASRLLP